MGIDPRRVLHIGVLMSVSTAAYALALAGVTTLQSTADRTLIAALVARLERRVAFSVSIAERELFISIGAETLTGVVSRLRPT